MHPEKNTQSVRCSPDKVKVVRRELENDRMNKEEMSAMNNFNSKLRFFCEATSH